MSPPRIVVDGIAFEWSIATGIARVWTSLLEEWSATDFARSLVVLDRDGQAPKFAGIQYVPFNPFIYERAASDSFTIEEACRKFDADLFISTHHSTPLETPSALLVHDMIPELLYPNERHKPWIREKRLSTYHASGYIVVSHTTSRDLAQWYPLLRGLPVCIAHGAVDHNLFHPVPADVIRAFRQRHHIEKPYFLLVGRRGAHKNAALFFKALSRLPDKERFAIVCVGGDLELEPQFADLVGGSDCLKLSLSDEELNVAYAGALAFVYPSKYEGFGLPLLEAMAAGCPIVTCANGSIPEVAEDAALYVDDSDAGGMLDALTRIQRKEIREPLIQSGIEKCRRFSWSDTAQTIAVFLTDLCRLNSFKSNAGGTLSSHSWRELRNYEWRYAQQKRLREILKRPELKSHVPQAAIAVDGLQELESDWIKAIAQEKDSSKEQ